MVDATHIGSVTWSWLFDDYSSYHSSSYIDYFLFGYFAIVQKNAKVVSIDDYEDVPAYDELALKKAVANQPVSVAIEGGGREFQLYVSVSFLINFFHKLGSVSIA